MQIIHPFPSSPSPSPPSLTANLILRILLALLANITCLVPLRQLLANGELAASIFIANVLFQNSRTILAALLWPDDDTSSWFDGRVLCDIDAYLANISIALYATCLLAVMHNLASQVRALRSHPLSPGERRRRNLVQALIMCPLPMAQMGLIYPLAEVRYWIGPLVGCTWNPRVSWLHIIFFVLAPMLVALAAAAYAVLIYLRFRAIAKSTASALSSNRLATQRAQRTKRRLYLMVISILVPFLPVIIALGIANVLLAGPILPYDFANVHAGRPGQPWDAAYFVPSSHVSSIYLNNCYIPILSAVPIFAFFGMTRDAVNTYRRILLGLSLGKLFPSLYNEYDPDRSAFPSSGSSAPASKSPSIPGSKHFSSVSSVSTSQRVDPGFASTVEAQSLPAVTTVLVADIPQPPPIHQNPFLFRTRLNIPVIPFPLSTLRQSESC